jgi:gliding motility associated protien GldN
MKFISVFIAVVIMTSPVYAQPIGDINGGPINVPAPGVIDGVYLQQHIPTKRLIPYEYVREADVIWSKRVWQFIDLREKINLPLYFPKDDFVGGDWVKNATRWSLWTVIRHNVLLGNIRLFAPFDPETKGKGIWDGDQLKYPVDSKTGLNYYDDPAYREELFYYFGDLIYEADPAPITDVDGNPIIDTLSDGTTAFRYAPPDTIWYKTDDVVQYRIKEDWFFDKERSVLDVRIIAIAPVLQEIIRSGQVESYGRTRELFWLYFPQCRFVLNNYFVYNEQNDAQWMSYDDLFWKRRFSSTIYKESNTFDRNIESYRMGVDALMEAEKIKEEIRIIEHDVWSF